MYSFITRKLKYFIILLFGLINASTAFSAVVPQIEHQSKESFLEEFFGEEEYSWNILKLDQELKDKANKILTHRFGASRIRYWASKDKTVWIIDELGKEMPITMAVGVSNNTIIDFKILVYREERGGEVHNVYFRKRIIGSKLSDDGLSKDVDGITGATISVTACKRVAELALTFHEQIF
ncbi:MAG: FMN-binding protein [Moraxellaceae bacterium]|nr:MAG: FMN-binding protein [Moraxellaceae bacterium]